tara:strand:+ start:897 stop:1013 length:117 start_codon:yes stop_codon:yes gene_type:complete
LCTSLRVFLTVLEHVDEILHLALRDINALNVIEAALEL